MMPNAGGQYVFLREGLAPSTGFLYGWTLFTVIQTGTIAAVAVAFARFLGVLLPAVTPDVFLEFGQFAMPGGRDPARPVAPAGRGDHHDRAAHGGEHARRAPGRRDPDQLHRCQGGRTRRARAAGLTLFRRPDVAAANFGAFWGTGDWGLAVLPVIGAAMVGSLFSSDAWNNVTFAAAEVRDPKRNLPIALAVGTGFVGLLYVITNIAYLNVLPFHGVEGGADVLARGIQHATQDRVGTAAMESMIGPLGATLMAIAILVSTFGCNNGLILAGARVYYAMARDSLFFRRPARCTRNIVPPSSRS